MSVKQKLELTWVGKGQEHKIEPRILIHDHSKDYGDPNNKNMLIHGDNLLALKALEQEFAGKIKCIYIDPPYNTGSAFEHYDDNLEHSTWLSLMTPRLKILRNLLKDEGSIWISIDCDEGHYLKVLCDEIFGRKNFVDEVVWQRSYSPINLKKTLSRSHDLILVYAKNKSPEYELNKLPRTDEANSRYRNPDNDIRGAWASSDLSVGPIVADKVFEITTPSGRKVMPPDGYCWRLTKERFQVFVADNRIWFGDDGNNTPRIKRFLSEVRDGIVSMTWWPREEVGDSQEAKREVKLFNSESVFETPKQERLLQRIITLATSPGDFVLDSFLGSGTTAAVAHKMGRRWIGIELGEHCYTHCIPRLQKVVMGEQSGISRAVNWQGGGGFKFYKLAPTLIVKDEYGMEVVSDKYNSTMLVMAVAKLQGYKYRPSDNNPYIHGINNLGTGYIYVTTQFVTEPLLSDIAKRFLPNENLLICASAFQPSLKRIQPNIKLKKIPESVLAKCEYGHDNYNLNVIELSIFDDEVIDWEEYAE